MIAELDRCLDAMERRGTDALVLGREANARTVSGANRLWLAGTRAVRAGVRGRALATGRAPARQQRRGLRGLPRENLYPVTWNPEHMLASLQAIPGLTDAHTVGVDGMTPGMYALFRQLLPVAEFTDAGPIMAELWEIHSPEKVAAVREAARVACSGLAAMAVFLRDGVRARVLRGVCAERFASLGVTTSAFEAVAAPIDGGASTWLPPERLLGEGESVALRAGALRDGWEGSLARTYIVGEPSVMQPPPDGWNDALALCRPGTYIGQLRDLEAVVYGVGRGVEPYEDNVRFEAGMVCALELHQGRRLQQDILEITEYAPRILTAEE